MNNDKISLFSFFKINYVNSKSSRNSFKLEIETTTWDRRIVMFDMSLSLQENLFQLVIKLRIFGRKIKSNFPEQMLAFYCNCKFKIQFSFLSKFLLISTAKSFHCSPSVIWSRLLLNISSLVWGLFWKMCSLIHCLCLTSLEWIIS